MENRKIFYFRLKVSALAVLFLAGCSGKKYPVMITEEDGVQVFTNPEFPKNGEVRYALSEEWMVRPATESPETPYLHDIQVDDGLVFVSDWKNGSVHVLDMDGRHVNTISGSSDRGFQSPITFGFDNDHTLWVLESPASQVSGWSRDGRPLGSFALQGKTYTRMEVSPGRESKGVVEFTVSRESYTESGLALSIIRVNDRGDSVYDYGYFRVAQPLLIEHEGRKMILGASPYAPTTVWRVSEDDLLYAGYSETYLIRVYDSRGKLQFKFGKTYSPVENPYRGDIGQPDWFPAYSKIWEFDEKGHLWIEVYADTTEPDILYDVFTPEGIYEKRVIVPERIFAFHDDYVFGIVRLETGERMIHKSRMTAVRQAD